LLQQAGLGKPIIPISNGIDLSFYRSNKEMGAAFRNKYGYTEADKIVMSVGLYIKRKGILDFVALAKALPAYQFIWFGYLNLRQVPREIREAVATKLPNLKFAGYVAPDELRNAYCGADLFFFPTYEETEGIVLLEALAMGQEILVRDIPIYEDDLIDGKHVYKGRTNDEFRRMISGILEGELPSLKAAGQERVRQKDLSCIGSELRNAYETAVELHKADK
jgi:1,2-diacylglycerol-3-alpha-glucose alpha-1,2-glucosyltransferase